MLVISYVIVVSAPRGCTGHYNSRRIPVSLLTSTTIFRVWIGEEEESGERDQSLLLIVLVLIMLWSGVSSSLCHPECCQQKWKRRQVSWSIVKRYRTIICHVTRVFVHKSDKSVVVTERFNSTFELWTSSNRQFMFIISIMD